MRVLSLFACMYLLLVTAAYAVNVEKNGEMIDIPICGGFPGLQCNADQWCDFPETTVCGIPDQFGACRPRPEICTELFMPVCGCNAKTYSNACRAAADGVDVAHMGACQTAQQDK